MESRRQGFTLLELSIVVAIMAVLIAIALPQLLRARMQANESNAISALRTVATAQLSFQSSAIVDSNGDGVGDFGTLAQLANPGPGVPPFIDARLGGGSISGYIVTVNVTLGTLAVAPAFTGIADPLSIGRTGVRRFYVDDTTIIRHTTDGSAASVVSPPLS